LICRLVCRSLSAYIDQEMPEGEQQWVGEHLRACASCHAEYASLVQTKRLVSSLKTRVDREEWSVLLASATESANEKRVPLIRTRPLVATALLSLVGLALGANRLTHSLSALNPRPRIYRNVHISHNLQEYLTVDDNGQTVYNRSRIDSVSVGPLVLSKFSTQKYIAPDEWQGISGPLPSAVSSSMVVMMPSSMMVPSGIVMPMATPMPIRHGAPHNSQHASHSTQYTAPTPLRFTSFALAQ
jgi:archaellum component FlaF (FlaF/FlaG flagellin family)